MHVVHISNRSNYIFQTKLLAASPTQRMLNCLKCMMALHGLSQDASFLVFSLRLSPLSSVLLLWWEVSGTRKITPRALTPAKAVCSQNISRHEA
jgi:hypothetical protein